jgi:ABC-type lipopolysaccharide export system ATPase subunit
VAARHLAGDHAVDEALEVLDKEFALVDGELTDGGGRDGDGAGCG